MTKYLLKEGTRGMFSVNTETNEINVIDYTNTCIDWVYQVPEDGVLLFRDETDQITDEKTVHSGDLVIKFYKREGVKNLIVVVDNAEWKENVNGIREAALERAKKFSETCDCACENCPKAA